MFLDGKLVSEFITTKHDRKRRIYEEFKKNSRTQKDEETYGFDYFSKTPRIVEDVEEIQPWRIQWGRNCHFFSVFGDTGRKSVENQNFFFFKGLEKFAEKFWRR